MSAPALYPLFLKLAQRPCVVVGGGPIAAQKAKELLEAGADLRVISPELCDAFLHAPFAERTWTWISRGYLAGDLASAKLVISATADPEVDALVYEEARRDGAWVNVVDVVDRCDFYAGAVVKRGPVQVAISTAGASPSLAIALRHRVDALLPQQLGAVAEALGALRPALLERFPMYRDRAQRLGHVVEALWETGAMTTWSTETLTHALERVLACDAPCADASTCCIRSFSPEHAP